MEQLFYQNPMLHSVETEILKCSEDEKGFYLLLDRTIFYPEGGGEPGDRGKINRVQVVDTVEVGDEIRHYVETPLEPGPCRCELDWPRRFRFMQHHTAQHLLTALAGKEFDWHTISFHLGELSATLDLAGEGISREALLSLEDLANKMILEDRAVTWRFISPGEYDSLNIRSRGLPEGFSGSLRIVTLEKLDNNTCGGLHVDRLSKIQMVRLTRGEKIKGGYRINFCAGAALLDSLRNTSKLHTEITDIIGCGPEDFISTLNGWSARRQKSSRDHKKLQEKILELLPAALPAKETAIHLPGADAAFCAKAAQCVDSAFPNHTFILFGESDGTVAFIVQQGEKSTRNAEEVFSRVLELTGGRGGGKGRRFQGKSEEAGAIDRLLNQGDQLLT